MSFKALQAKMAKKQGVSAKVAGAELAASTRRASPAAKKANPNLKKVKMPTVSQARKMPLEKLGKRVGAY